MIDRLTSKATPSRRQIKIIFEFYALDPRPTYYRGVQAIDAGFRMEKRGQDAKRYKAFMWCGSKEGLYQHREAVERWYKCHCLAPNTLEEAIVF
jgi:hypothetical protein